MGGGMKAGFWLEAPLSPDIGNAGVGFAFTRRSTVSLNNAWGEVRLGRDETATYYMDAARDLRPCRAQRHLARQRRGPEG
jgi:predicted porin